MSGRLLARPQLGPLAEDCETLPMSLEVMCAFCGEGVDRGPVDPCQVIVVSRWLSDDDEQREQAFFAHATCLGAALHPDARAVADVLDPGSGLYLGYDDEDSPGE